MPAPDFDVAIVGAGPAGATTALALVRASPWLRGRVVLLERHKFPRDKPCAGALGQRGDRLLEELGVAIDVPSVPIDGMLLLGAEGRRVAAPGGIGRVVRRIEFDHALARAAVSRGVELRDAVRVDDVRDEGPDGVVVLTSAGPLRARAVIGCDGVGSLVRKKLGQGPGRFRAQVVEADTEAVAGDAERSLLVFDASDPALAGYAWDFPTIVDGRPQVCRGAYRLKVDGDTNDDGLDVGAKLDARLRAKGVDPSSVRNKRYAERGFEVATCLSRGGLMLAGEAAGIDPVTGEGIAQAIEYGVLAGGYVARALESARDARVALEGWTREFGRSRLGIDLRIRTRLLAYYYGPRRLDVERFLIETPRALRIGCDHFAARPHDWLEVGGVVARGAAQLLGRKMAAVLGGR